MWQESIRFFRAPLMEYEHVEEATVNIQHYILIMANTDN